jgi:voltage-gated potassium channel
VQPKRNTTGRQQWRELLAVGLWIILVLTCGTLGYALIEGWSLLDALFITVLTVSFGGFREVGEISAPGQVLTIALIVAGVASFFFAGGVFARTLIKNMPIREAKRMQKSIDKLSGHIILCGCGRLGAIVRAELSLSQRNFVVIERDEDTIANLREDKVLSICGDATDEETLKLAGIERAAGVIAAVGTDADNVFITLTARRKNRTCPIVARAEDPRTEPKLMAVGATSVVTPYQLGGHRLAQAFLRPGAVDLADLALGSIRHEVLIEEVVIPASEVGQNRTLKTLEVSARFGLIAIAVRNEGQLRFNPRAEEQLEEGDALMVMGHRVDVDAFAHAIKQS